MALGVGASAGSVVLRVWRATASSEASMALSFLLGFSARRFQFSDLGRGGGVVVGLVFLIVGGLGGFDLRCRGGRVRLRGRFVRLS